MSSSIQTKAFAQQDVTDTRQDLVATNVQTPQTKVAIDADVLMSEEDCVEREMTINIDQQTTTSESNQNAWILTNVQPALNIAITPDIDLAGCNPTYRQNRELAKLVTNAAGDFKL